MTYIVDEPYDYRRLATAEVPSLEFLWAFYAPMALGLPLNKIGTATIYRCCVPGRAALP